MRAVNHAITGAIIGLVVSDPLVAVPVSVLSHYIMDAIPHHGEAVKTMSDKNKWIRSNRFRNLIYADAILCAILVLILALTRPFHWVLAAVCAFGAAAPDLLSINHYQKALEHKKWKSGWYTTFAGKIQWFERPIGALVEVAWFIAAVIVITPLLR
jgi:hypothetical protein